jgi:Tim44-like domain
MRPLSALALASLLLVASPAFAQIGDPGDSSQQMGAYGQFFAYVVGAVGGIAVILFGILDDTPQKRKKETLYLGEKVPDWKVGNRRQATEAALRLLSRADDGFTLKRLTDVSQKAFVLFKGAIEERATKGLEHRLTPACLDKLRAQVKELRADGERRVFGKVEVTEVEIVHVEAPEDEARHTFTALISARSKDYIADDKTGKRLRGDKETYAYQEFLQFRRAGRKWLLERVRSSSDMDRVLFAKNVLNQDDLTALAKKVDEKLVREFVADDPAAAARRQTPPAAP